MASVETKVTSDVHGEDAALLECAANGERDALARLYDRYAGLLLGLGVRILGERREAEDVVHDVFLEAWKRAGDYDRARGTVRSWLVIRMRSRCLDRVKSARRRKRVPINDEEQLRRGAGDAGGADIRVASDAVRVREVLGELPLEQRQVIELGYFEGLSSREIAERVGVPVGTVKSRVAAALRKLRAGLGAVGDCR